MGNWEESNYGLNGVHTSGYKIEVDNCYYEGEYSDTDEITYAINATATGLIAGNGSWRSTIGNGRTTSGTFILEFPFEIQVEKIYLYQEFSSGYWTHFDHYLTIYGSNNKSDWDILYDFHVSKYDSATGAATVS